MDQADTESGRQEPLETKEYLSMNEQEKDLEITRSIIRLQNRIQNILFHERMKLEL